MLIGTGLKIHTAVKVIIPAEIGRVMLGIAGTLPNPQLEYGLYLQGVWDPQEATVTVKPDQFYFPQQETTAVSIRFLEEPPGPEWNVVIHRHPQSCRTFSSTDRNSINEEFLASILYIPVWEFPEAVVNIPIAPGAKFQTKAKILIDGDIVEIPDWLRERVGGSLQQLKVVQAKGPQPAGRGTIEALDGDGTIKIDERRSIPRVGPRRSVIRPLPPVVGGEALNLPPDGQLPLLSGDTTGFALEDLEDIHDAALAANLGLNT